MPRPKLYTDEERAERHRIAAQAYNARNPNRMRRWYLSNRKQQIAKSGAYQKAHREELREYFRHYRAEHKDEINASNRKYRSLHPGVGNDDREYRRVLKLNAYAERIPMKDLRQRDNNTCQLCRKPVGVRGASIDHIIPVSLGGSHTWANVQLAHTICNSARGVGRIPAQMRFVV